MDGPGYEFLKRCDFNLKWNASSVIYRMARGTRWWVIGEGMENLWNSRGMLLKSQVAVW